MHCYMIYSILDSIAVHHKYRVIDTVLTEYTIEKNIYTCILALALLDVRNATALDCIIDRKKKNKIKSSNIRNTNMVN